MEDGIFPSEQSRDEPDGVSEERRLAYVAITRAKERLFITHAKTRITYRKTTFNLLSRFVREELGFIAPFDTFMQDDVPNDPLAKEVLRFMQSDTQKNVPWRFSAIPSLRLKEDFGASLLAYAQGKKSFASVISDLKASWKNESK
jgi:ATP-dependent exoDNAse (exonuclease V) beta subunit